MNLDDTITFTITTADDFGDDVASTEYETDCAVEQASAFNRGLNAELQTGEIIAWIAPDSDVWTEKGLGMSGITADYQGTQYRVTGVRPGGSLITGEADLIELTLTKAENAYVE
jgi:hypothetical protein